MQPSVSHALTSGACAGLNQPSLKTAFGISQDVDVITLDALDEAQKDPESEGAQVYKQAIAVQNTVTLVSNLLTNDSSNYASFAVLVDQSIGRAVSSHLSALSTCALSSAELSTNNAKLHSASLLRVHGACLVATVCLHNAWL